MILQPIVVGNYIQVPMMTKAEARAKVNSINAGLENIRKDLLELYEREGWRALGYSSWRECGQAEFHLGQTRIYQLLDAARVERNISTIVEKEGIPESNLRPLVSLPAEQQREAWTKAEETAPDGKVTAAHIQSVVSEICQVPHVAHNSGNNEWYTPTEYAEAARSVMGVIDLDPASTVEANKVVRATRFFSREQDGLAQDWIGCVFMNPPYAAELIGKFCAKLVANVKSGNVTQAIVLVNNATETAWFFDLASVASIVCFPRGRVKFWSPDKESFPLQGQAVLYIGNNDSIFAMEFGKFGWIARP